MGENIRETVGARPFNPSPALPVHGEGRKTSNGQETLEQPAYHKRKAEQRHWNTDYSADDAQTHGDYRCNSAGHFQAEPQNAEGQFEGQKTLLKYCSRKPVPFLSGGGRGVAEASAYWLVSRLVNYLRV